MKPFVYVAGPLTDHVMHNTSRSLIICSELYQSGLVVPFSPHTTVLWDMIVPADYEQWMEYDFDVLNHMHAVYRIQGKSPGADREVEHALRMPIPVFYEKDELFGWAAGWPYE